MKDTIVPMIQPDIEQLVASIIRPVLFKTFKPPSYHHKGKSYKSQKIRSNRRKSALKRK